MDTGAKKGVLLIIGIVAICATIIVSILVIALWEYRVVVGMSLLIVLLLGAFSGCVVALRGNTPTQTVILKQEGQRSYEQPPSQW